jgi:hypothetical protein
MNSSATREWQIITGCTDAVPTETSFPEKSGTQCSHWNEECMQEELMTGSVEGELSLSRITIGALEDIGYEVDYGSCRIWRFVLAVPNPLVYSLDSLRFSAGEADSYTVDDVNPKCICNNRKIRNLRGESVSSKYLTQEIRKLSDKGLEEAKAYGRSLLKQFGPDEMQFTEMTEDFIRGRTAVVFYLEEGEVFSVTVTSERIDHQIN